MGIVNPNSGFQIAFQQNFLARFFEEGLDSEMAYRRDSFVEMIPNGNGETVIKTKVGRSPAQVNALLPQNVTGLDNGLNYSTPSLEQYAYVMAEYGAAKAVDLIAEQAGIANQLKVLCKDNGVQAAQTVERLAKKAWFASYNTGNTWIRGDLASPSTSSIKVDDIRGFMNAVDSNGKLSPVSSGNPLVVNEYGTTPQQFSVIAAVADATTASVYPSSVAGTASDGVSGTLTISPVAGSTPTSGDSLVSAIATPVLRPSGKKGTQLLNSQDLLTLQLLLNAKTQLQRNAIPRHSDGTYHVYYDHISEQELFSDQQFQIMSASRIADPEDQNGQIFTLFGMKFIPTTEAYLQALNTSAGMQSAPADVEVHRVLVTGGGGLYEANFTGLEQYAQREGFDPISRIYMVDHVAHIIRPPIDNLSRQVTLSWLAVKSFVCPTDLTATPATIPTATNAAFKRAVVIEHC